MATIDISPESRTALLALLQQFLPDVTVWAYGSRVKGTTRRTSDLDLVVFSRPEQEAQVSRLKEALEESSLPFRVDLLVWDNIPASFQQNIQACYAVLVEEQAPLAWKQSSEQEQKGKGMSAEWPLVRLGDYVDSCLGKMLDAKKNKGLLHPYLGNSNVRWGTFDLNDLAEMKFEAHEEERYSLLPGDLVVCEGGEPGRCAIWTGQPGMKIQKALHRIRPKDGLNNYYLFYWFNYAARVGLLEPFFTGTTIKHLTGKAVSGLHIPLPPLSFQIEMVNVLRALDDRIALLRETNATLEAIAQALFKSWFVDFDPVHAKARGEAPQGMDEATAALFPDSFEESELGMVPKGWRVVPLSDAYDINPTRKLKKGTVAPYLDMASVATSGHSVSGVTNRELGSGTKFINGDTLLARITPCLENGKTAFVDFLDDEQVAWGSTEFVVLRPKAPLPAYHGYLLSRHPAFREYAIQSMSGTSGRQRVQNDVLGRYPVIVPSFEVANVFAEIITAVQQKIAANHQQAQTLAQLRDTLLPKLISGQLRLPEAENILKDSTDMTARQ